MHMMHKYHVHSFLYHTQISYTVQCRPCTEERVESRAESRYVHTRDLKIKEEGEKEKLCVNISKINTLCVL